MPATILLTPPVAELIPLELARQWLRVDAGNGQELVLPLLIGAAIDYVERYTGRALTPRTAQTTFYVGEEYALPLQPAGAPTAVTGAITDLADLDRGYSTDYQKGIIVSRDYPLGDFGFSGARPTYAVTYPAGYAVGACPAELQAAVLKLLSELYENREFSVEGRVGIVSVGVRQLLDKWRVTPVLL